MYTAFHTGKRKETFGDELSLIVEPIRKLVLVGRTFQPREPQLPSISRSVSVWPIV